MSRKSRKVRSGAALAIGCCVCSSCKQPSTLSRETFFGYQIQTEHSTSMSDLIVVGSGVVDRWTYDQKMPLSTRQSNGLVFGAMVYFRILGRTHYTLAEPFAH